MPRRSARIVSPETSARLLATMRECRHAAATLCGQAKIGGPEYEAASALARRIDDMAGVLTGNRELFWTVAHSHNGPSAATGKGPGSDQAVR